MRGLALILLMVLLTAAPALAHGSGDASVRVVSADPAARTYTLRCVDDPATNQIRDWFIRPDDGIQGDEPEIAEFPDRPADQDLTFTFPTNEFYHIGCNIVYDNGTLIRGDLHIDLRPTNDWNPRITPVSGSGNTVALQCDMNSGNLGTWEVLDARTHQLTGLGTSRQVTYTAAAHGLYDFFCSGDGNRVPLPVEIITGRDPYFPDRYGVAVNGSTTPPNTTPPPNQTCYNSVRNIPATCEGATISSDTWDGGRHITCGSTTVAAWDKTGYFEMYKQAGGSAIKICIGNTCIKEAGYAKSANYPICAGNTTPPACTPTNGGVEVCDQQDNDCDSQVDEGGVCGGTPACFTKVNDMPLTCTGGTITLDEKSGCRKILCSGSGNSIQVLACDKPTTASAEYFEMYRQSAVGTPPKVCLGPTCIQYEGFKQSGHYPICVGNTTPPACTPTAEVCDGRDNDCDTLTDEDNICSNPPPNQTCYNSVRNIPATCEGATISSDTWDGGRHITCGSTTVAAWDKTGYFEMYKQAGGSAIKICIGNTCIKEAGYAKSANYPICAGNTTPSIVWIEPVEDQQNTPPSYFHLNVQVPPDEVQISKAEWEIWDSAMTDRVWSANTTGNLRFHTHSPDGSFQGSLSSASQLLHSTQYKVRTRWQYTNGTSTPWSSVRSFTTSAQQNGSTTLWSIAPGFQLERVAVGFDKPVHIAFAPEGMYSALPDSQEPHYYVTELYGKVKVVHKDGSIATYASDLLNFDPFGSLTGGGQMGTIGLYVDNTSGDLFVGTVYVEGEQVKNKVIRFTSSDDGNTFTAQQTIISGMPSAPSHQIEQISKGPDGRIYVALGDALDSANAQSDTILAGKIIRMNPDGTGIEVYAKGLRNPFGHDWRPGTGQLFSTDNSPDTNDRLLRINQGENYLWGTSGSGYITKAIDLLNPSPVDVEFNPGNAGFPNELNGRMYVAVAGPIYAEGPTNGKEIIEYTLDAAGNITGERPLLRYTGPGYSTPIGMDFGPDGLYFTDIYGESGAFDPPEGAVFRITPGTSGCVNCGGGGFRAGIAIVNWYPKYIESADQLEYLFECKGIDGSGSYKYDFDFGDGASIMYSVSDRQGHRYAHESGPYTITCKARDQGTGLVSTASMTINPRDFVDDGVPGNDY